MLRNGVQNFSLPNLCSPTFISEEGFSADPFDTARRHMPPCRAKTVDMSWLARLEALSLSLGQTTSNSKPITIFMMTFVRSGPPGSVYLWASFDHDPLTC